MTTPHVKLLPTNSVPNESYLYAVICTYYQGKLLMVRTNGRESWELPGGHREPGELINDTASRELKEETGAVEFSISPVADYCVEVNETVTYGRLFRAEVERWIPPVDFETDEVGLFEQLPDNLTYPAIQPLLRQFAELTGSGLPF